MDGFKKLPKMKTGGSVCEAVKKCYGGSMKKGGKYKEGGDIKQDKALIKKAFKQHDEAEHDKEPTEIKLKHGGRSKKEAGTVKKYKAGGAIEMKKSSGDLDTIKKIKATKNKKADAPNKATLRPNLKGSDVEKEKSKPAGEKDTIKKVPPTGDKKADAPNKAAVKKAPKGEDAVDDIDGMKKGHAVKKHKAGGHIKHMADGSLAAPIQGQMGIQGSPNQGNFGTPPGIGPDNGSASRAINSELAKRLFPGINGPMVQNLPNRLPDNFVKNFKPQNLPYILPDGVNINNIGSIPLPKNSVITGPHRLPEGYDIRNPGTLPLPPGSVQNLNNQSPYTKEQIDATIAEMANRGMFSHTGD